MRKKRRKKATQGDIAELMTELEARENLQSDPGKTIKIIDKSASNPNHLIKTKIQALVNLGEFDKAERLAKKNVKRQASAANLTLLAQVLYAQQDYENAERFVREAITKRNMPYYQKLLAEILRKRKLYQEALEILDQIDVANNRMGNELCRAYCYMHLFEFGQSFQALEKAEELAPEQSLHNPFPHVRLFAGYIFLYGTSRQFGKAGKKIREKASIAANWFTQLDTSRLGIYQKKDYESALEKMKKLGIRPQLMVKEKDIEELDLALQQHEDNDQKYVKLLLDKAMRSIDNNPNWAMECILKAEENNPQNARLLGLKTRCLLKLEMFDQALEIAKLNHDLHPNNRTQSLLAIAYKNAGQLQKAYETAQTILELDPIGANYGLIATICINMNRLDEALEMAKKYVEIEPIATALSHLAIVYKARGELDKAEQTAKKMRFTPKGKKRKLSDKNKLLLADILFTSGKYVETFKILQDVNKRTLDIYLLRAFCNLRLKRYKEAFMDFDKAQRMMDFTEYSVHFIKTTCGFIFTYAGSIINDAEQFPGLFEKFEQAVNLIYTFTDEHVKPSIRQTYENAKAAISLLAAINLNP